MKLWGSARVGEGLRIGTKIFDTKWIAPKDKPKKEKQLHKGNSTIKAFYYIDPDYDRKTSKPHTEVVNGEERVMIPVKDQKALDAMAKLGELFGKN